MSSPGAPKVPPAARTLPPGRPGSEVDAGVSHSRSVPQPTALRREAERRVAHRPGETFFGPMSAPSGQEQGTVIGGGSRARAAGYRGPR